MVKTMYDLSILDNTTGREFEIFLVNLFEKLGYSTTVTNRSKDYGCDLMLQRGDYRIAVQAKRSESELNFTSVQRVLGSLKKYNAQMSIVVTNNKFISSAKQLAKIKDVVLIDRKKLLDLIELSNLPVNHKKDLIQFSNKTRQEIIKQEIDKETFNFLGLDIPKVDHSLLTKDAYGRPHPLNNKKEKLIDIFKEIRDSDEVSIPKENLLNSMEKYPLMFGTRDESEKFLLIMIKESVIFKPKIDYYNLV
jgi:Holliday junction resolvase-like predicted endonuclease